MIELLRSGGQNGADLGGIKAAKDLGFNYMMLMPKGYKTLDGPKPEYKELYNALEHDSSSYKPRTYENVKNADLTIRLAKNFLSPGEKCTLEAILKYKKPKIDIHIKDTSKYTTDAIEHPYLIAKYILLNNYKIINIAGNSEKTAPGIEEWVYRYIKAMLLIIKAKDLCKEI